MRASYTGFVQWGLLNVGVRGYPATASEATTRFKQLSGCCDAPISQVRKCQGCGNDAPYSELRKGLEMQKPKKGKPGEYLVFTDEELEAFYKARSNIEVKGFVESVPSWWQADTQYYLEPDKGSETHYALLWTAMRDTQKSAVAAMTLAKREKLVIVTAQDGGLWLRGLHYGADLRPAPLVAPVAVGEQERQLAAKLIGKAVLPDFSIAAYTDPTETALRALIDAKLKGEAVTVAPLAPAKPNLLDALTAMAET